MIFNKIYLINIILQTSFIDGESYTFTAISKVSSGFSTEELAELSKTLSTHWKRVKPGAILPSNIEWGKNKPDLWIEPESSIILQVKKIFFL